MARAPSTIMSAAEQKSSTAAAKKEAKAALKTASANLQASVKAKAAAERAHARNLKDLNREHVGAQKTYDKARAVAEKFTPEQAGAAG